MALPLAGKRIGLLAGWASRRNGGVFEALVHQAETISELGGEAWVFAAQDEWCDKDRHRLAGAQCRFSPPTGTQALAFAPGLSREIEAAELDCLHLHGIWQGSSWTCADWSQRHPGRTVISPHGMLDPWITARGRIRKAAFRALAERRNWRSATLFHALTQDEATDIRHWAPSANLAVIPNPAPPTTPTGRRFPPPELIYLGRIHEKKNLAALIAGWQRARPSLPRDARLTIAGNGGESDVRALKQSVADAGAGASYIGACYGAAKQELFASARFMVLASHSEGLPMAILEAWAAGLPTIMSDACHLPEGLRNGAALRCGTDPAAIAGALTAGFAMGAAQWQAMSQAAFDLATGPFSHRTIASRWATVYDELMQDV